MASTLAAPHVHPAHFEAAAPEAAAVSEAVSNAKLLRNVTISLLVFEVVLLGSISLWLWYGLHQYQNCL